MKRRKAIKQTTLLVTTSLLTPSVLISCKDNIQLAIINNSHKPMLISIADTLLPETKDSPGALQANLGNILIQVLENCYTKEANKDFVFLLNHIENRSKKIFNTNFITLSFDKRLALLRTYDQKKEKEFIKLKELIVYTFFTSEIGMTKVLRYLEVPGHFDGCLPYAKGDKAWAWCFF
ncbi:gluconate 2-dehydrogenase subunit 3 family protein [Galbibacter orientalis]|uniref:gluconate 2-dehydrogenase subunit 3 family protein n=1 Tax=Galbibacter orientalis TaxID=453852 RepID=UPI003080FB7C